MRSIKNEPVSSHSKVELSRRVKEDPLTMIKEKEFEKKKILWKKSQMKNSDAVIICHYFLQILSLRCFSIIFLYLETGTSSDWKSRAERKRIEVDSSVDRWKSATVTI